MGRTRKYATEEEAHEAKKQQMRENYQKRKAAKAASKETKTETVTAPSKAKTAKSAKKSDEPVKQNVTWELNKDEIINKVVSVLKETLAE